MCDFKPKLLYIIRNSSKYSNYLTNIIKYGKKAFICISCNNKNIAILENIIILTYVIKILYWIKKTIYTQFS